MQIFVLSVMVLENFNSIIGFVHFYIMNTFIFFNEKKVGFAHENISNDFAR